MFTQEQLEEMMRGIRRGFVFILSEEGELYLNIEGISDSEDESAELVDENDFSWELDELLLQELNLIARIPKVRKAYEAYSNQTPLFDGMTIEYRFGFDLATDRMNGMVFSDCGLDDETAQVLSNFATKLGTPDFYLRGSGKIDASW